MIRRVFAMLVLAAVGPITIGAAMPVDRAPSVALADDAEQRWVPFEMTPGNQIRFAMEIDGKPVSAVLDTGVSYSLLAKRYAAAARLKSAPIGNASAIGGEVAIGWVRTRSVAIGGLTRSGGGIAVADLPMLATGGARPIDALIGRDVLADAALDLDYDNHRFRLIPSGRMPFAGSAAPLSLSPARSVYVTSLSINGRRLAPVIVDTGDGSSVTLSATSWSETSPPRSLRVTDTISYGIGGSVVSGLTVLDRVGIGSLVARSVEVRIEDGEGFSQAVGMAGRIGTGLLQRYRVLLDPGAGRMVLAPGATADVAPDRSTSGLLMGLDRGALVVLHVMGGSPAAATGWKTGERICAIDGAPIPRDYASDPISRWSAGAPGRTVRLGLCDGGERRLTLRTFY